MSQELGTTEFWDEIDYQESSSPMKSFFRGKTVFLTGGTGFLGLLYVEKLLRTDVKRIYVLARAKKGKSAEERIQEVFSGSLFHKTVAKDPHYIKRIKLVEGDLAEIRLAISDENLKEIEENVDIVLHAAADVRFDEKLSKLLIVNLRGTREMMRICENIKNLQVVAYISTAFSNCHMFVGEEKFYPSPIDPELMIQLGERFYNKDNDEMLQVLTERIIHPWPNTYTYTKCLSEEVVRRFGKTLPICVIRPSIIVSTHDDPIPGWCNNIYGLNGVIVACGLGLLRIMPCDKNAVGDIIMADFVTNGTFAAIWYTKEKEVKPIGADPTIYQISSSSDRPVTWKNINNSVFSVSYKYPSKLSMWYPCNNYTTSNLMWLYCNIVYHVLPAFIFDFVFKIIGKKERLVPAYRKINRFMLALRYFMTNQWHFHSNNIKRVIAEMDNVDQNYFACDVRKYDWNTYSFNYYHGIKLYLGNDHISDSVKYNLRFKLLTIAHFIVKNLYYIALFYFAFVALRFLGVFDYILDIFN